MFLTIAQFPFFDIASPGKIIKALFIGPDNALQGVIAGKVQENIVKIQI
jgi:hypothetical protein